MTKISPSILSADFGKLNEDIQSIEDYIDWIHIDVMDGHFVPNITFGAPIIRCIKSKKPLDCHLMIQKPEKYIFDFIESGAFTISTHIELGIKNVKKCMEITKNNNLLYGIAVNPSTDINLVYKILNYVDYVLIMSVNPGFGGQVFMPEVLNKIKVLKEKRSDLEIQIDGGINNKTALLAKEAGATNLVSGSYIFGANNRIEAIENIKNA